MEGVRVKTEPPGDEYDLVSAGIVKTEPLDEDEMNWHDDSLTIEEDWLQHVKQEDWIKDEPLEETLEALMDAQPESPPESPSEPPPEPNLGKPNSCRIYFTMEQFTTHIKAFTERRLLQCEFCLRLAESAEMLELHLELHKEELKRGLAPYLCSCGVRYTVWHRFIRHAQSHADKKVYMCECQKTSGNGTERNKAGANICECGRVFLYPYQLQRHRQTHLPPKIYCCPDCTKVFSSTNALNQHKTDAHKARPVSCKICSKTFTTQRYLSRHLLSHVGHGIQCEECGAVCSNSVDLQKHKRQHKEDTCVCECGEKVIGKRALRLHRLNHQRMQLYICGTCGKECITQEELQKHTRKHRLEEKSLKSPTMKTEKA